MDVAATGIAALILAPLLPQRVIGIVIYGAVRPAIPDERRNHER